MSSEDVILEELAAIFRGARGHREPDARLAFFESLRDLERRARTCNAADQVLTRVTESRFLAGILRDSVSPAGFQCVRGSRHLWTVAPDLRAGRETAIQA